MSNPYSPFLISSILEKARTFPAREDVRLAPIFGERVHSVIMDKNDKSRQELVGEVLHALADSIEALRHILNKEDQLRGDQALEADERSRDWLTIGEIQAKNLPGLPRSRAALKAYLDAHGITANPNLCRKREHTGRGIEYRRSALSRAAIVDRKKWAGVDIEGLESWLSIQISEQSSLTPSGLRQAYVRHLRAEGSKSVAPALREFSKVIKFLSGEGR